MAPKDKKSTSDKRPGSLRICICGPQIGKTRLVMRYLHDTYEEENDPTLEDQHKGTAEVDGVKYDLDILDTSGDESYSTMYDKWFSSSDAFILVYSVNDFYSFDAVQGFRRAVMEVKQDPETPMLLVATQADDANKRKIATKEGRAMASKWCVPYIECSAKNSTNIKEAFLACISEVSEYVKKANARETRLHNRPPNITIEGKINKKEKGLLGSKYGKRWIALADNYLYCFKSDKDLAAWKNMYQVTPLYFAKVNQLSEEASFEVVAGTSENMFQCDDNTERDKFMTAFKNCSREYATDEPTDVKGALSLVHENEWNRLCADCGSTNADWASTKYGVVLCLQCATIHRNLKSGTVTAVKSLTLDEWDVESVNLIKAIGNQTANAVLEGSFLPMMGRPVPADDRDKKLDFIRTKYLHKKFLQSKAQVITPAGADVNNLLFAAVQAGDLKKTLALLCYGADVNYKHAEVLGQTCIHQAVATGNVVMLELLLAWGTPETANIVDDNNHVPLHYATEFDKPECAVLLVKRGAAIPDDVDIGVDAVEEPAATGDDAPSAPQNLKVEEVAKVAVDADRVIRVSIPWLEVIRNIYVSPKLTVHEMIEILLDKVELTEEEHADLKLYRKETKKYLSGQDTIYDVVTDKDATAENYEIREPKGYLKRLKRKEKLEIKKAKQEEEKKEDKGLWKKEKATTPNLVSSEKVTLQKKHKKKDKEAAEPVKKLYYGCSMKEISERDNVMIPRVVIELIDHLKSKNCEQEPGIFRLVGDKLDVEELKNQYNAGAAPGAIDFAKYTEVNVHASALKLFFRELTEPLVPYSCYDKLIAAHKSSSPPGNPATNEALKAVIDSLPQTNKETLAYLIKFLVPIAANSGVNMMNASNLGICFGPTLIQPDPATASITAQLTDIAFQTGIIRQIIENASYFFE